MRDYVAEAASAPDRETVGAIWQAAREAAKPAKGRHRPDPAALDVLDAVAAIAYNRFGPAPTVTRDVTRPPRRRPDGSTPWRVVTFCDATAHDPAARPRVLTADHDGGTASWRLTLHGGHLQVIDRNGERVDKRHWDDDTRAAFDGGRLRLRAVIVCRDCGRREVIAHAATLQPALDHYRQRAKRNARLTDVVTAAAEALADWADPS